MEVESFGVLLRKYQAERKEHEATKTELEATETELKGVKAKLTLVRNVIRKIKSGMLPQSGISPAERKRRLSVLEEAGCIFPDK